MLQARHQIIAVAVLVCTSLSGCMCGTTSIGGVFRDAGTGEDAGNSGGGGTAQSNGGGTAMGTGGGSQSSLIIDPPTAEIVVRNTMVDVTQLFTVKDSVTMNALAATWSINRADLGAIDQNGLFRTRSVVGGVIKVQASANGATAEATLTVRIELSTNGNPDGGGVVPPDIIVLLGNPVADAGTNGPTILYPYQNTVFPRGILSPLVQYSSGGILPVATRITITAPNFTWNGFIPVTDSTRPSGTIPEDIWDAALRNASGSHFTVDVIQADATAAYGPTRLLLNAAPGSLKGSVYFMTYDSASLGVWRVKTATKEPPSHIVTDCTVCHSISANGQRLVTGGENNGGGVFTLKADGGVPLVSAAPPGLGGDSRGLSFSTLTPDGKYILRSRSDFWGGINQTAWRIDEAGHKIDEAAVVGMGPAVSAYIPTISPDGRYVAFTQGQLSPNVPANTSRAIKLMDLSVDDTVAPFGQLTFTNERTLIDNGATGPIAKFVTFLPNTRMLAFQESTTFCTQYNSMLPTWDATCQFYSRGTSQLMFIDTQDGGTKRPMAQANAGLDGSAHWQNYEPFALPSLSGGYFWIVFTSSRAYGNVYPASEARKQLWVTAINPNPPPGADPSFPAFYLPNQLPTQNERGFWALDPCHSNGDSCETGDECCEGFCRAPSTGGAKVCSDKPTTCSQPQERCRLDTDCCPVFEGPAVQCLGGFCATPLADAGIPEIG